MISVNGYPVEIKHFPDGTQRLLDFAPEYVKGGGSRDFTFVWKYENDEELVTIMFLVNHLRDQYVDTNIKLIMNYVPNARMDRVKSNAEVFTLKWFCKIINSLNFDSVKVMDPHSYVCEGLLNHLIVDNYNLEQKIKQALIESKADLIYFPDAGALKRYSDFSVLKRFKTIYGKKNRDWETGKITGLTILSDDGNVNELIKNSTSILMIDDIIAFGSTMYYSAIELRKLGAQEISAYVTHTENSVLDPEKGVFKTCLEDNYPDYESRKVNMLYTTDSIFNGIHPKIKIL